MVALQKAVDDQNTGGSGSRSIVRSAPQQQLVDSQIVPAADEQTVIYCFSIKENQSIDRHSFSFFSNVCFVSLYEKKIVTEAC